MPAVAGAEAAVLPSALPSLAVAGNASVGGTLGVTGVLTETGGTNTAPSAGYSNPAIPNNTTGIQVNATKDAMVYLEVTVVMVALVISIGPAATPTNAIFTSAGCPVGSLLSIRVPAGWYIAVSYTSGTLVQSAVTC